MPLKSRFKFKSKKVIIRNPKGFVLDDPETDVVALRQKGGKTLLGVTFTKVLPSKAPKPPKALRMKKKPGRKRKRGRR